MSQLPETPPRTRSLLRGRLTTKRLQQIVLTALLVTIPGCSRGFWRQQADRDAYEAINERVNDPRWQLPRVDLEPDPESRFYDPHDPDKGPLPPDDPSAHDYMQCVDGISGYKSWHKLGDSFSIENPQWLNRYGLTPEMMNLETGDYTGRMPTLSNVTLVDCVELSQIHSRELQTQIENMYLAALDVTFQRFQFNVRYLGIGGGEPSLSNTNTIVPGGTGQSTYNSSFGVSKLLPAGGQVAAELANSTLWLFQGPNQTNSVSVLSYSLTQPLLLGAGRKVQMENLTQAERTLLYQARTLSRFRQSLFTNVVSDTSGSYLNLIQQTQVIRNQEGNIERLKNQVAILQSNAGQKANISRADLSAMPEGLVIPDLLSTQLFYEPEDQELLWRGQITPDQQTALENLSTDNKFRIAVQEIIQNLSVTPTPLDVLNLQGNLASSINQLRTLEQTFESSLDALKLNLGLPPDIVMTIDDSMLEPFTIIDPQLKSIETEVTDFISVCAQIDQDYPTTEQLLTANAAISPLLERVERVGFTTLDRDAENLKSRLGARLADLDSDEDRIRVRSDIERDLGLLEGARDRLREIKQLTSELNEAIQAPEALMTTDNPSVEPEPIPALAVNPDEPAVDVAPEIPADRLNRQKLRLKIFKNHEKLLQIARSLIVVEIGLRVEQITVPAFEMPLDEVIENAVENRVDLMNQKAIVMDDRRNMEVVANRMKSSLSIKIDGDIRGSGGNTPFDFRGNRSQLRAGLGFTAPLDQIAERNNYRTSLISYQRSRRDYMALEDTVKQGVRRNWRQLSVLKRNLETSRLQLRLAARQYDSAVDQSNAPAATTGGGGGGQSGLQGNNLIQALNSIVSAQNALIQNWITYEQNRLGIYRDMGMMEIGPDGIWNDRQYRGTSDQETQEGLPGRQILPEGGPDDGSEEIIPDLDGPPRAGISLPGRSGNGWDGESEGIVLADEGAIEE